MAQDDRLRHGVVAVLVAGKVAGSGIVVGTDGSVLTCFHVVGDPDSGKLHADSLAIRFGDVIYPAECLYQPTDPLLDIAVLRPLSQELPRGAIMLPLGLLVAAYTAGTEVGCFGYSPDPSAAAHTITAVVTEQRPLAHYGGPAYFQLATGQADGEILGSELCGAPVYDAARDTVIAMVTGQRAQDDTTFALALPIEAIARAWAPLRGRLQEDEVARRVLPLLAADEVFSEAALRSLFDKLTIYGVLPYDALPTSNRQRAIIDQLRSHGLIYDLVNAIKRERPDMRVEQLIASALGAGRSDDFVDRERELHTAQGPYAAPYLFFDAPAGYGKTELLYAIKQQLLLDGWLCFYLEIPPELHDSLELVHRLARAASLARLLPSLVDLRFGGSFLTAMLRTRLETFGSTGAVILLDNLERLAPPEADRFLNEFVKDLVTAFHGDRQAARPVQLRLILAGRYAGPQWKRNAQAIALQVTELPPFNYRSVRETIRRQLNDQVRDLDLLAAHVLNMTGGHPGCIAETLRLVDPAQPSEQQMQGKAEIVQTRLLPLINEARRTIPEPLRLIFDNLSVFRRSSQAILHTMLETGIISYPGDARQLEADLITTYLVRRRDGFIQDESIGRLLALRLRWTDSQRFLQLCRTGRSLYERAIATSSRPEIMAMEAIYQELQIAYYESAQDRQARAQLRERFFHADGILQHYLRLLGTIPDAADVKANLHALLDDEHGDWEFQFAVNFFLRDEQFDDQPSAEVRSQIKRLL